MSNQSTVPARARSVILGILVFAGFAALASAQPSADTDAARLRALFFQRDYESGTLEGERLVRDADPGRLEDLAQGIRRAGLP